MRGGATLAAVVLVLGGVGCTGGEASDDEGAPGATTSEAGPAAWRGPGTGVEVRWAELMSGPTDEDEIDGVAAGPDGTAYVTGKFERTTTLGGTELTSAGRADIPLAAFDADGTPRWVTRFGGPGEDNLFDIDADERGAVGTGWFEGTVDLGPVTLTSAGSTDCLVVAVDPDGAVRWAESFGGPGPDGCNEVTLAPDGGIVTSLDTTGGWDSPAGPIPPLPDRDTLLLRLGADGTLDWGRRVGGDGSERGKAIAVGPDGSVAFGGDATGDLRIEGTDVEVPGSRTDAWLTHWSPAGDLEWSTTWGGAGRDIAKGLVHDGEGVIVVGSFGGAIDLGGTELDAGDGDDIAVARFTRGGDLAWATAVQAEGVLSGAEAIGAPDGGVVLGFPWAPGLVASGATGGPVAVDPDPTATAVLAHYRSDGSVGWAQLVDGTPGGNPDEMARVDDRLYVDIVLRGEGARAPNGPLGPQGKDSSLWALDIVDGPR